MSPSLENWNKFIYLCAQFIWLVRLESGIFTSCLGAVWSTYPPMRCSWITKINYLGVWDEGGLSDHKMQWGIFFLVKRFWIVCFFAFLIGRKEKEEVFSEIASFVEESIRGKLIFSATILTPSEVHRSTKHIDKNALAIQSIGGRNGIITKWQIEQRSFENILIFIPIVSQSFESYWQSFSNELETIQIKYIFCCVIKTLKLHDNYLHQKICRYKKYDSVLVGAELWLD